MAKYNGKIGFRSPSTTPVDGIIKDTITERTYSGELLRSVRTYFNNRDGVSDNLKLSNRISIIADDFANVNSASIIYIHFNGAKWKVTNIEHVRPRMILTLGEVYNGPIPG